MRLLCLAMIALMSMPLAAQDEPKAKAKKKAVAKKSAAHTKPTPEQIRRFRELEKKKQRS